MKKKLRTGFTTGTAAAAAAKGALLMILEKKAPPQVSITLLTGDTLKLTIHTCKLDDETKARCTVIKDAGDDPDVTHKAEIGAIVKMLSSADNLNRKDAAKIIITAGEGVGRVTKPGLEVLPGEPAILASKIASGFPNLKFVYAFLLIYILLLRLFFKKLEKPTERKWRPFCFLLVFIAFFSSASSLGSNGTTAGWRRVTTAV